MQIPLPLLFGAQQSLNALLAVQAERDAVLEPLAGKVIAIQVLGLDLVVYLLCTSEGVELARFFDGDIDVTLAGTPMNLLSMTHDNDALYQGNITIDGELGAALALQQAMMEFEVDWEEHLSGWVGDTATQQVSRMHRGMQSWLQRTLSGFNEDAGVYLQDETELLAPVTEIHHFCRDVDTLRNDTERLSTRIEQLQQARSLKSGGS
ncbi:MAG: SCP2 sterol-binding domain-containing protein [Gammaproteobacteria bacterium]|nr:SCP2 sterol-binding domain-containing protein [Gammaproteobacteria bacterium]